jgi:poly(A) polymerase
VLEGAAVVEPTQTSVKNPDRERAAHALERAVECAERGVTDRPVTLALPEDVIALGATDVRTRLDRVMMGDHADLGLDALLVGGVLDALLPEVKAMVGFGDGEWRHKDVWKHTKQVVATAPSFTTSAR